ncbi:MAG: DUF2344 domain-containing protein [Oscillospiraceae bacterium]|nr:DUF2344 domain-containing protein [Oscillospiraceae bacterium]
MRRMRFQKTGKAVWMSHLDTMRLMQRAFRRAGVLLHHSQGYTPHAYVSLPIPLSVGMESLCEILEYELDAELTITPEQINKVLPEGILVTDVYESDVKTKHLCLMDAELLLFYDQGIPEGCVEMIEALLSREELLIEKRTKRGPEEADIRPLLKSYRLERSGEQLRIFCTVCAQNPSLNPMLLIQAIERYAASCKPDHCRCRRLEIYDENGKVFR